MLINIIESLYELEYESNTIADKKHEKKVEALLVSMGFTKSLDKDIINILKKEENINKKIPELISGKYYIVQPFGTQMSPDFIISDCGYVIWIECKSGKNKITWNSNYPRENILYVFSCKLHNTTTIFFGEDRLNQDVVVDYKILEKKYKKTAKEEMDWLLKPNDFSFYLRPMINDNYKYSDQNIRESFYEKTIKKIEKITNE